VTRITRTTAVVLLAALPVTACATERSASDSGGDFPEKSLTLSVPFPAGGPTDTEARLVAKAAEEELGESITIRNVDGAGGTVLWNEVPEMDTSGYELVMFNLPHIVSNPIVQETEFDASSFEFLVLQSVDPTAFFVRKESPFQSLEDVVSRAKQNPGSVTVGTAGNWLAHHLAILALENEASVDLTDQPFDGSAPEIQALLGGHVDVASGNVSDVLRSGADQFRVLAVASEKRSEFLPEAPTFKELGYDVIMSSDRGIAAPTGVSEERLAVLREAFENAARSDELQEKLREVGSEPSIFVGAEIGELVNEREARARKLLEESGELGS
jgi:tripartite-type tricarboxylate transporter receptor subunit TctC